MTELEDELARRQERLASLDAQLAVTREQRARAEQPPSRAADTTGTLVAQLKAELKATSDRHEAVCRERDEIVEQQRRLQRDKKKLVDSLEKVRALLC